MQVQIRNSHWQKVAVEIFVLTMVLFVTAILTIVLRCVVKISQTSQELKRENFDCLFMDTFLNI